MSVPSSPSCVRRPPFGSFQSSSHSLGTFHTVRKDSRLTRVPPFCCVGVLRTNCLLEVYGSIEVYSDPPSLLNLRFKTDTEQVNIDIGVGDNGILSVTAKAQKVILPLLNIST
jgi:hypothetical protein